MPFAALGAACSSGFSATIHPKSYCKPQHETPNPNPNTPPSPIQLLVDCEGIDAVDQGQQHSAQIFSLAVLLSSVFVYNQLGAVDAVALERLAMVCELAKRIKGRAGDGGSSGTSSGGRGGQTDFHPAFVWLLRDFQLQLAGQGGAAVGADHYLEEVLAPVRAGGGADEDNRNEVKLQLVGRLHLVAWLGGRVVAV